MDNVAHARCFSGSCVSNENVANADKHKGLTMENDYRAIRSIAKVLQHALKVKAYSLWIIIPVVLPFHTRICKYIPADRRVLSEQIVVSIF